MEENRIVKDVVYTTGMDHNRNIEMLNPIFNLMKKCYGPFGGYTLLSHMTPPRITKDGVSILQNVQFDTENNMIKAFMDILKKAAARNDMKGGDGTTTTVMLIIAMYEFCAKNNVIIPGEVIHLIEEEMKARAFMPETEEDLVNIARVALNNDEVRTKVISDLFAEMKAKGLNWKDFSIIASVNGDIQEDKVSYAISEGIITYSIPIYEKPLVEEKVHMVYVGHQITNGIHLQRILELASVWMNMGNTDKLVICSPKIERVIADQFINVMRRMESTQGIQRKIELIDIVNPVMKESLTASDELATAMGAPIIQFENIPDFDFTMSADIQGQIAAIQKDKGISKRDREIQIAKLIEDASKTGGFVMVGTIPDDDAPTSRAKVQSYFANMLKMVPTAIMSLDHSSTKFVNVSMHPLLAKKRENKLFEIENLLRTTPLNTDAHAGLSLRFKNFIQKNVFLNISGSTEEKASLEYDTYRDACVHMETAKQGIISGMNIGMLKLLFGIKDKMPENKNKMKVFDILVNSYLALIDALKHNKEIMMNLEGTEFDIQKLNDMIMLVIKDPDIKGSFNLITETPSDKIMTSALNELNILKTAVETVDMLMKINQVGMLDHINVNEYVGSNVVKYRVVQ